MEGFGSRFIQTTFGVAPSALHYWDKSDLIKPSLRPAAGRGSRRLYSFPDLVQILVVARLRSMGLSLQRIRRCLAYLREEFPHLETPLASLSLLTDGETIFRLTDDPEVLLDLLRRQFVWSVPISAWIVSAREAITKAVAPRTEKMMVAGRRFAVTMEQDPEDGWWVGLVKELPGCGSQGSTLEELREMVADAIREYLIARGDVAADEQQTAQAAAV
jgi:DNA-binding transcriptional MerR regulator